MEQQEALLRQTNSNPWFLFKQGVLALKDAKGNKIYSDYGDARARVVAWRDMPVRLRALLGDVGPARWLQHPFNGYSVHFFLRAFELGKPARSPATLWTSACPTRRLPAPKLSHAFQSH